MKYLQELIDEMMFIQGNWNGDKGGYLEEQAIKAEIAWNKLMETRLEEQKKELSNRRMYEQGRKELIEKILKDAPGDMQYSKRDAMYRAKIGEGFNKCNSQWRELLNNLNPNPLELVKP